MPNERDSPKGYLAAKKDRPKVVLSIIPQFYAPFGYVFELNLIFYNRKNGKDKRSEARRPLKRSQISPGESHNRKWKFSLRSPSFLIKMLIAFEELRLSTH
jgi:hypothetical protein